MKDLSYTVVSPKLHHPELHQVTQTASIFRACIVMQFA